MPKYYADVALPPRGLQQRIQVEAANVWNAQSMLSAYGEVRSAVFQVREPMQVNLPRSETYGEFNARQNSRSSGSAPSAGLGDLVAVFGLIFIVIFGFFYGIFKIIQWIIRRLVEKEVSVPVSSLDDLRDKAHRRGLD